MHIIYSISQSDYINLSNIRTILFALYLTKMLSILKEKQEQCTVMKGDPLSFLKIITYLLRQVNQTVNKDENQIEE